MGNAFQNIQGNPQQYPMSPFSLSQVQRFQTGVQNTTSPGDISNNCTENNVVFSNANHHTAGNEFRHHFLPQSDPLRDDKVKHLEHLLESALETARLIQADETISESDVLSARGHTVFKSLQSLLQSPVRRDLNSRPKSQRRLFNWSQIQMRIQRVTGKEAKEPSSTNCI